MTENEAFCSSQKHAHHGDSSSNKSNTGGMSSRDSQQLDIHIKLCPREKEIIELLN